MRTSIKALLVAGAVSVSALLAPVAAHADLPPLTYDVYGGEYLDCETGVWWVDVDHYTAEQTEPGVYAVPVVTYSTEVKATATEDECPTDPGPPDIPPSAAVFDATPLEDAVVWKLGIFGTE